MNPGSAIKKGKAFENLVAADIEAAGLGKARREIGSGAGKNKGDIFSSIPFLIEAKNQKALSTLTWIDQAKSQAEIGNWDRYKWALVFQDPRTHSTNPTIYVTLDWYEFLKLLKKDSEPLVKEPDRALKFDLQRLKDITSSVLKKLK